jgi:CO/xanthine dehydrogenase Mo-binding subunit
MIERGAAAMENRGIVADWDKSQHLTVWTPQALSQSAITWLAGRLSEGQVRVIAPFIGGGFGLK